MTGDVVSVLLVLAATQLVLGWYLGFQSLPAYLACWTLFGLASTTAWRLARSVFPWAGVADALIRLGVIVFALVVLSGLTLGGIGLIAMLPYLGVFAAGCAATLALSGPRDSVEMALPRLPISVIAVLAPLLVCMVAVGLLRSPLTLYDSISYHLVFSARWLQDHRLSIIPTPFSDPAQAYQPGNGELFFLWLMLPFHGDFLARIGQLPFLVLGATALYAIARRCGARPEHAAYAPLFFLLSRPVVEQAVGADVDLVCAAMFLTSLYVGLAAVETDAPRDWALWGVSLGLYVGSKYLALVYLPVLLVLPLLRGVRRKALWAVPGIAGLGFPWYARNWLIAGSPIYPASLKLLGVTFARGAFAREAMRNSVFHLTSVRLFPVVVAHAFGATSVLFWLPFVGLGAASLLVHRRRWPAGYVVLIPLAMTLLFWFGVPDNADSRFLLPAVAVAMVPLTFAFGSNANWNAAVHAGAVAGAAWIVVGVHRALPATLPWFMRGWLTLDGIVARESLPLFIGGVAVTSVLVYVFARLPTHRVTAIAATFGVSCVALTIGSQAWCTREQCDALALSPIYIRTPVTVAWQWVHDHIADATIANTGNNVPYPLFGEHLSNRVRYVNIDRRTDWGFHDYARARGRSTQALAGTLARPSGQLEPLVGPEGSRPRYERWEGYREAWIGNLNAARSAYLFVSVLSPYELDYVWHNDEGFPVEDTWARTDTQTFHLVFANSEVRVYELALP